MFAKLIWNLHIYGTNFSKEIMRVKLSECCDSIAWNDSNICAECRKKAEFYHDFWYKDAKDETEQRD